MCSVPPPTSSQPTSATARWHRSRPCGRPGFDGLPAAVTLIVATVGVSVGLAARWCGSLAGRLRLAGLWGAGPALASLVTPALGTWRWLAGLAIYTFGAMVATSGSAGSASDQRGGGLDAAHRTAVVNLLIQVALMAVLAALAVWVVAAGDAGHVTPVAFAGFNSNLLISAGTLIFAGVGCLTPLAAYPSMSDPGFRKRVVNRAMWFAAALKTSWILLAIMVVAPQDLLAHSQLDQTSAQGVAGLISTFGTGWMGVAAAVAAVLAFGIGLTSAGAGFSESLALEALSARAHLSRRAPAEFPSQAHHQLVQRMVIAVCAVAAGILNMVAVFASLADALLAIGGLAGGGILVFICGAIAEPDPRRRSRARIEALAAGAAAGTLTTLVVFHTVGDAIRVALTVGAGVVSLLIVYLIDWATTSAPVRRPARALVVVLNASKQLLARETQIGALLPPDRRLVVPAGNVDVFGTTVEESLGLTGPACLLTFTSADTPAVAGVSAAHAIATGGAAGSTGERSLTLERATAEM